MIPIHKDPTLEEHIFETDDWFKEQEKQDTESYNKQPKQDPWPRKNVPDPYGVDNHERS